MSHKPQTGIFGLPRRTLFSFLNIPKGKARGLGGFLAGARKAAAAARHGPAPAPSAAPAKKIKPRPKGKAFRSTAGTRTPSPKSQGFGARSLLG